MSNTQQELLRGQNRSKRAIAESVAGELTDLIPKLNKTSQRLKELCSSMANNWEGAAADAFIQSVKDTAAKLEDAGNKAKTIAGAIKTAAEGAYPEV